jgi:dTDP-glucose 4,6-dehydratase
MGKVPRLTTDEQRLRPGSSEVERLSVNVAKFSSSFGWRAEFSGASGFELGLQKTIAWFSDEANLSRYKVARYNV